MAYYKKVEDNEPLPCYEERIQPEPQYAPYTHDKIEQQKYSPELNRCCAVISVCNFICCLWCGIPALIFTILGLEAEKRNDRALARVHGRYMSVFNKVGCYMLIFFIFFNIVFWTVKFIFWEELTATERFIYTYTFTTPTSPTASGTGYHN